MTWMPGTYDPELNLLYWGTGNPNPVFAGQGGKGANLWTASIVALNADTGKLVWYHQPSPHDTHDWDNVETPVLFDGLFNGKPRKMLAQAARNGIFTLLDRTNGESLVTKGFVGVNWMKGVDAKGQPIPDPAKEPKVDGSLINTPGGGATNWPPPSFNPETGLFYVNAKQGYSVTYLTDNDPEPQGYGGGGGGGVSEPILAAIDYKTGNVAWKHKYPSGGFGNCLPGRADHGGQAAVHRRSLGQPAGLRSRGRSHPVAFPDGLDGEQRTIDLHAERQPIPGGRRGRYAVRLQAGRSQEMMTRREILRAAGAASAWLAAARAQAQTPAKAARQSRRRARRIPGADRAPGRGGAKPFDFVEHCHTLGLGVVETRLPARMPRRSRRLRQKVEGYHMRLILDVGYPRDEAGRRGVRRERQGGEGVRRDLAARRNDRPPLRGHELARRSSARISSAARNRSRSPNPSCASTACAWASKTTRAGARRSRPPG